MLLWLALTLLCLFRFGNSLRVERRRSRQNRHLTVMVASAPSSGLASMIAGSLAGAIGTGAGYPLDTLKTKAQTYAASSSERQRSGLIGTTLQILDEDGFFGLYTGVWGTMAGQAIIKACAFWSNRFALDFLVQGRASASLVELALAAGFCGFVTSFVVNPIERIKVILQSKVNTNIGSDNYWRCFLDVLSTDGLSGLMFRGIEATLLREIPGYGFYFFAYQVLKLSPLAEALGPSWAALVCGALAGMISWLPVYPADIIKTNMQARMGGRGVKSLSMRQVAAEMMRNGGVAAFYDGIGAKLIRAAVAHGVTFFVYDRVMNLL